jgi:hypothetical protein
MCATAVGVVIEALGDEVVVDLDGRIRRAGALATPGLRPGDHVLIGLGMVLARVEPDDHAALESVVGATTETTGTPAEPVELPVP